MANVEDALNGALADIGKLLAAGGKKIEIISATDTEVSVRLSGFCGGGCGCSESYMQGVRDVIAEHAPTATVTFVS